MKRILNRILPPARSYPLTDVEALQLKTLHVFIWVSAAITLLGWLVLIFLGNPARSTLYLGFSLYLAGLLVILIIERFVPYWVTSLLFDLTVILAISFGDTLHELLHGESVTYYIIPVAIAGLLIRPWAGYVVAVTATLVMTIATIFLNFGSPNIPAFMLFFMVALIIQQSTYRLHHAMVQEQKKSRELRESEEKYRRLIDLLPIGVLVNQDGKVVMINPAGMKMAGANTPDEVLGASLLKFVHPDFREKALERMQTAFAKGINARPIEQQLLRLDGSSFDAESTGLIFTYNGRPAILAIFNDISERKQAREAILAQNKRIEEMSGLLLDIQEKERRLLATELHDDLGQSLTSLKLMLELCSRARSTTNRQKKMAEARGLVSELMEKVRNLSLDLRPTVLDDYGLFAALRWFVDRFKAQTGLAVHCNYDPECSRRFAPHVETAAFRIIQEALTNVARHASVAKAEVSISTDGPLAIEVADAGLGFDVGHALQSTDHSAGLSGMQERARLLGGRVDILSNPGVGTRVVAHIPLNGGGR